MQVYLSTDSLKNIKIIRFIITNIQLKITRGEY